MNTTTQEVQKLADQEARDRFAQEIDVNFSVIAPAGVGKTTAIVQRIINIANSCDYNTIPSRLSKLIVVTYTQKAADEMRHRTHQALLKANAPLQCLEEFNKAFFGTIHSFCLKIIQSYGPQIGVPGNPSLLTDDTELWHEFLNSNDSLLNTIPNNIKDALCKHVNLGKLSQLARKIKPELQINTSLSACPKPNLQALFSYTPKKHSEKILQIQNELQQWWNEYTNDSFALEIPEINQGDSGFKELCSEIFSPLWNWLGDASLIFIVSLAQKYQQFRIQKGFITYDDMVSLAAKLITESDVISSITSLDYHIILDEAQDTDAQQFKVLLGAACIYQTTTTGKGRFCMLGDPQQAIYSSRADLPTYLKIHNDLEATSTLQALTFNVTMRCDREIVSHCNDLFPSILKNKTTIDQTSFVPLCPRPWAKEGFVGKIHIDLPKDSVAKLNTEDLEKHEAKLLAHKIHELGHSGLGITDWSEVAILTPRKSWLAPIAIAFQSFGIPTQIHSRDDIKGDNPTIAWLTAVLTVITSPNDSFEITGVLRDIFGISDDEIASFVHYWDSDKTCRHPLNISQAQELPLNTPVKHALNLLCNIRNESILLPLSEAIRNIIKKIRLRDRLASLPDYESLDLFDSLDILLIQATLAEEHGNSIAEFTETLRKNFLAPEDPQKELKGHIQFYTSHKAKGLEWPVVIVPFLFRNILFPSQEYPQLISIGSEHAPKIVLNAHPDKKAFDDLLHQYRIAELERLLYVTATRARNTLLWADDESLFSNSYNSFASLLKITHGNTNRQSWNNLTTSLPVDSNLKEHSSHTVNTVFFNPVSSFDPDIIPEAKKLSKNFLRLIAPSQVNSKQIRISTHKKIAKNYSPIEYGNWWHKMMETLPWCGQKNQWEIHLKHSLIDCPEPSRGEFEFQLFLKSTLLEQLLSHPFDVRTELPFFFKNEQNECCGGVIDFFAVSSETQETIIIDWKTDLFDETVDSLEVLKETYFPQLSIYREVINKIYSKYPRAFIFNTPLGKMVEF